MSINNCVRESRNYQVEKKIETKMSGRNVLSWTERIKVLDHLIIGDNRYTSLAAEGLIEEYELYFLGLKMKGVSEARRRIYRAKLFGGLSDSST